MSLPQDQFRHALTQRGIIPPDQIIADGKIHRADVEGKNGKGDAAYLLHGDGQPAGGFENHQDGLGWEKWGAKSGRQLVASDRASLQAARTQRSAEEAARREKAREQAMELWSRAEKCTDHPYLRKKAIHPRGARILDGDLLLPLHDTDGTIHSLQTITNHGEKRFLPGGRVSGSHCLLGRPNGVLLVAEGFATASSLRDCTGHAVAAAFSAGNLAPVATALRAKFPDARIVICADADANGIGETKARKAASAIGAAVALPVFEGIPADGLSDFNDLHRVAGIDAVRRCVENAQVPERDAEPERKLTTPCAVLTRADSIKLEPISWLWDGWLAAGKLHILAGAPGTGKTTIVLAMAATITMGGHWPDRLPAARGSVVIWSGEDDPADTLAPRLQAMGADMSKVHFVSAIASPDGARMPFDPARDVGLLSAALAKMPDVQLLVVDPIVSAVAGDSHNNAETRRSLQPLVDLAAKHCCALIGITHLSKGTAGRDPVERVTGSIAFGALARVVLLAAKQPAEGARNERRLLLRAKSNIGPDTGGYVYDLRQVELKSHPGMAASSVSWGGAVEGHARELLAEVELPGDEDQGERHSATDWLREALADGPLPVADLKRQAKESGFAWRTMQRTMHSAGVVSRRAGFRQPATWSLGSRANPSPFAPVAPASESGADGATDGVDDF